MHFNGDTAQRPTTSARRRFRIRRTIARWATMGLHLQPAIVYLPKYIVVEVASRPAHWEAVEHESRHDYERDGSELQKESTSCDVEGTCFHGSLANKQCADIPQIPTLDWEFRLPRVQVAETVLSDIDPATQPNHSAEVVVSEEPIAAIPAAPVTSDRPMDIFARNSVLDQQQLEELKWKLVDAVIDAEEDGASETQLECIRLRLQQVVSDLTDLPLVERLAEIDADTEEARRLHWSLATGAHIE